MKPVRIQLSRRKGWRMPPNTVKVDRTTRFGNPFIVGANGNAAECVYLLILLQAGYLCLSHGRACCDRQEAYQSAITAEKRAGWPTLRGKNLACWCSPGTPCHADVQLEIANRAKGYKGGFDLDGFMARYGYRMVNGRAERL